MAERPGLLTLTTDFGLDGPYVAAMKGVVLGLVPGTQLVDISHSIAPQDIVGGAFVLAGAFDFFPRGTVHLAVVDPGVGTSRRLAVMETRGHWFVLPDNGLIGGVLGTSLPDRAWEIRNPNLWRSSVSNTFHGRDILAPVAAHLLRGGDPDEVGPSLEDPIRFPGREPFEDGEGMFGEVVFVDSYGNLITNLSGTGLNTSALVVEILGRRIDRLSRTYADQPLGSLVALVGSSNRVEVAVVNGNAARDLEAGRGTSVCLRSRKESES